MNGPTPFDLSSVFAIVAASYVNGTNLLVDNGFSAAVSTNQIDYTTMPAVDALTNSSA